LSFELIADLAHLVGHRFATRVLEVDQIETRFPENVAAATLFVGVAKSIEEVIPAKDSHSNPDSFSGAGHPYKGVASLRSHNATSNHGRDGTHYHLHDMIIRSRSPGVGARAIEGPICNSGAHSGSISFIPKDDAYRFVFEVCSDPIYMPSFKGRKNFGYGSCLIFSAAN
jgi:hypothetical protein